ncbi:hypothetical protein ACS0TY_021150 [Phlomoides rotata]
MSDEFKEKSNKQKGVRASHKYPHRLSRKGYTRYANEIRSLLSGDPEVDRTILWLEGRKIKKGEELKETVSKIVQYIEKKKAVTIFYGVKDGILAKALESDEHAGRVRGVGGHVTPSSYFDRSKRKGSTSEILERLEKLEKEVYRPYTHSSKNENENFESPVEKCSYSIHCNQVEEHKGKNVKIGDLVEDVVLIEKSDETLNAFDVNLQGKPVALHLKPLGDIVAYGTIIKAYGPTKKIHSKILPKNFMRVSIDTEVIPKAKLPI